MFCSFQNGEFLKDGDGSEPSTTTLVNLNITTDTLTQVFLGMCAYNERYYNYSCTTPGGRFTDFNVWIPELLDQEMKDWTACK